MTRRAPSRSAPAAHRRLNAELLGLGTAVPQVLAHRLARMALAGPTPSAADRDEFNRMVTEKWLAFQHAWLAMASTAMSSSWSLWSAWGQAPFAGSAVASTQQGGDAHARFVADVLSAGLAPVRATAQANAQRLGRRRPTRLR